MLPEAPPVRAAAPGGPAHGAEPSYLALSRSGELARRALLLEEMLSPCCLCPNMCGTDRRRNPGACCGAGLRPIVSAATPHMGEEPPLSGTRGVGNIFFGRCNLRCVYCQNHLISQGAEGEGDREVSSARLAELMLSLQERGCHLIGFVSPTHFVPQVVAALDLAAAGGLRLPLVYNTNAYDSLEVLRLLDGIVDVYLPDLKYMDADAGFAYSGVRDYPRHSRTAIREMHRQVGGRLIPGPDGTIRRGLIIRHLVLPNDLGGSREALRWIRKELGAEVPLSIMSQYYPAHRAAEFPLLARVLRESEYERVVAVLDELAFAEGWIQEYGADRIYRPDFTDRDRPFHDEPGITP
ncbi:MAG: radical SAM protein [Bacteroidota bacterium]